jgi:hypothetical protein
MTDHPIKSHLLRTTDNPYRSCIEAVLLEHGCPFIGIARPKGFRLRAQKNCYMNAAIVAVDQGRGTYVEGLAIGRGGLMPHAWLTLDGTNAVDITWREPAGECQYFGIPFSAEVLRKFTTRTRTYGPLLEPNELQQVLIDAGLSQTTAV